MHWDVMGGEEGKKGVPISTNKTFEKTFRIKFSACIK